jgi:hypothetical protein
MKTTRYRQIQTKTTTASSRFQVSGRVCCIVVVCVFVSAVRLSPSAREQLRLITPSPDMSVGRRESQPRKCGPMEEPQQPQQPQQRQQRQQRQHPQHGPPAAPHGPSRRPRDRAELLR